MNAQRKPGPSLVVSLSVLGLGIVLGVLGAVEAVVPLVHTLTRSTSHATPAQIRGHLSHGTYEIYQLTTRGSSILSLADPSPVEIGPSDVTVTSASGERLTVTNEGADETLTLGSNVYTGAVQFAVPASGDYVVEVRSSTRTRVVLARSIGSIVRSAVAWIITGAAGGLLAFVGIVLLIVGLVRRRNRPAAYAGVAGTVPPANWYADPSEPAQLRYWDGRQWTDQTYRS